MRRLHLGEACRRCSTLVAPTLVVPRCSREPVVPARRPRRLGRRASRLVAPGRVTGIRHTHAVHGARPDRKRRGRDTILTRHGPADLDRLQHHRRGGPRVPRAPPEPAADPRLHPRRRGPGSARRVPRGLRRGEHRADRRDRPDPAPLPHRSRDQSPAAPPGRARDHRHRAPPGPDLRRPGLAGARPLRGVQRRPVRPALPRLRERDVVDAHRGQAPVRQVRAQHLRRAGDAGRAHLPGSLRHRLPRHPAQPAEPAGAAPAALAGCRRGPRGRGLAHGALRPARSTSA